MLALRRASPLLLLAAALVALAVLFAPGAQPADAQSSPPTVTLAVSPDPVVEGNPVTVTVTLSRTRSAATTVSLSIPAKGALSPISGNPLGITAENDDRGALASITIPGGQRSATGQITTAHDADTDDEVFLVQLSPPTGSSPAWVSGSPSLELVKIIDDEGPRRVSLEVLPNPVIENQDTQVFATLFTIDGRTKAPLSRNVTIPLTLTADSAEAGDYGSLSSITITAGDVEGADFLSSLSDADNEDETFTVSLGSPLPSGISAGRVTSVTLRITDDESASPGTLSVTASPACSATITVLTETPSWQLTLDPAPALDTGVDYQLVSNGDHDWLAAVPINSSTATNGPPGKSVETSFGTFAQLLEAYPGFAGINWRLNDHPDHVASCYWAIQAGGV